MNAQSLLTFLYKKGISLAVEKEDLLIDDVNNVLNKTGLDWLNSASFIKPLSISGFVWLSI